MTLRLSTAPHIRSGVTTASLMRNVLISLIPCVIVGIYNFGWDAVAVIGVSMGTAIISEYLFQIIAKRRVQVGDLSCLVTGLLLALTLPSTAPWWMVLIGSAFAIVLVKELFGGIGSNFMNPALTARAVLLASWPVLMTKFVTPTYWQEGVDAVTTATPLAAGNASIMQLLTGAVGGSIGEVSKIAILIGFIFLLVTGTISWRIPVCMVGAAAAMAWILKIDPLLTVLEGGLLFGAVFMATDYTTSPMTAGAQCIYACVCGILVVIIRKFGSYPEGVTYAILFMNIVTPLLDKYFRHRVYGHGKEKK